MSEFLEIKLKEEKFNIETKQLKAILDFSLNFDEMIRPSYSSSRGDIVGQIHNELMRLVVDRFMEQYADEIIKRVDLDALVKRVQLNVLTRISG